MKYVKKKNDSYKIYLKEKKCSIYELSWSVRLLSKSNNVKKYF